MGKINSKTVVFIHGAFVTKNSWGEWPAYFESKGYKSVVPAWPFKDASPAELRKRQPDPDVAKLRMQDLIDHFTKIVSEQEEKPIAIGHSYGGLLTQILLNRDLVVAGVGIHSVPPQGVIPTALSFYKATWGPLGYFTDANKTFLFTQKQWNFAFANGQSPEDQKESYEEYAVPESKRINRDAVTKTAKVDWKKTHGPLLITSGDTDQILPVSISYSNYKKYNKENGSVTDYKEFKGRNHSVLVLPTWKEDADYIIDWLERN